MATELRRCLTLFGQPLDVLRAYVGRKPYPGNCIVLKRGMGALHLANRTEDVITTFVVLVRDDYGPIKPGSVVLDIGANIGAFAVKALIDGAALVYCVEPSPSSVRALIETVASCPRSDAVIIDDRALWGADGHTVFMPQSSSPSAIAHVTTSSAVTVGVSTVSFATLFERLTAYVDLVKIDCEGAEYRAVLESEPALWRRVGEVRMEYHNGRVAELVRHFKQGGLVLVSHVATPIEGLDHGVLVFRNPVHATRHGT
ncbi:MAG: FkbM family methyltransferase [Gemmatimonadaceae bacterium]